MFLKKVNKEIKILYLILLVNIDNKNKKILLKKSDKKLMKEKKIKKKTLNQACSS